MFPSSTKSTSFSSALGPICYVADCLNLWYTYIQSMCIPIVYASIHWFRSTPTCCISLDIDSTELRFIVWAAVRGWWQNILCAEMKNFESVGIVCNMLPCLLVVASFVSIYPTNKVIHPRYVFLEMHLYLHDNPHFHLECIYEGTEPECSNISVSTV